MIRLKSIVELEDLQQRLSAGRDSRRTTIVVSAGTCGQASGANELIRVAKREILARKLTDKVGLRITGCQGWCEMEPSLLVEPLRTFYPRVTPEAMVRVVEAAERGEIAADLVYRDPETNLSIPCQDDIPFFKSQVRNLMARNEQVDPIRIYNYIESGGYSALRKVLERRSAAFVLGELKASNLRGRGGAGFPTGLKWEMLANARGDRGKFLVCNADEGDPGAYMNRAVLEGNPHSIIEGMIIGAFATGADKGVLYVRAEYPLAIKHLMIALRQARDAGLLGADILGTGLDFDLTIVRGAGAFVCGEETALIRSIEGKMGEPRQRPPFPVQRGINGKPTAINNVETWANIPLIFDRGAAEFARTGTPGSPGTKIFSLVGKARNTGLVEVPMGVSIGDVVFGIGGGSRTRFKIKGVQMGGPSGGCIPVDRFDLPIDYDRLREAGAIMGSGGMIVMDEGACMVDLAKYFMNFLKDESCGKCFTCRVGTKRMWEILDDISRGRAEPSHVGLLEELAHTVRDTTMCGLGQTAANPVLSTLRYFRDEYTRHIEDRRCDAFVCRELVGAPCQAACPLGTEPWRYAACIEKGDLEAAYEAIREPNPLPSVCARVCHHPCEAQCRLGKTGQEPVALRSLKRYVTDRADPSSFVDARGEPAGGAARRVAVIGGGPAGLSAAHFLWKRGHSPTIFEAEDRLGGLLAYGIPEYRLPKKLLDAEIAALVDGAIEVKLNSRLGKDLTVEGLLKDGFDAVLLATGAGSSRKLGIEGEDAEGVIRGMDLLKAWALRGEALASGRVAVIGGGNAAVDAARTAIRQPGVKSVTILYRRTKAEMPAFKEEVEEAVREGVEIVEMVSPLRIEKAKGGKRAARVVCAANRPGALDLSGRRSPIPVEGSERSFDADMVIVAVGEEAEGRKAACPGLAVRKDGTLEADPKTYATGRPGVFAAGDLASGPDTVVWALAAGKRAAACIDRYLAGIEMAEPAELSRPSRKIEPSPAEPGAAPAGRAHPPALSAEERRKNFREVETGLTGKQAAAEARRCARCDLEFEPSGEGECAACSEGVKKA